MNMEESYMYIKLHCRTGTSHSLTKLTCRGSFGNKNTDLKIISDPPDGIKFLNESFDTDGKSGVRTGYCGSCSASVCAKIC